MLPDGSVLALYGDPSAAGTALALLQPPAAGATAKAWKLTRLDSGTCRAFCTPSVDLRPRPSVSLPALNSVMLSGVASGLPSGAELSTYRAPGLKGVPDGLEPI